MIKRAITGAIVAAFLAGCDGANMPVTQRSATTALVPTPMLVTRNEVATYMRTGTITAATTCGTVTVTKRSDTQIGFSTSNGTVGTVTFSEPTASGHYTTIHTYAVAASPNGTGTGATNTTAFPTTNPGTLSGCTSMSLPVPAAFQGARTVLPMIGCNQDPDISDQATADALANVNAAEVSYAISAAIFFAATGFSIATDIVTIGAFTPGSLLAMGTTGAGVLNAGYQLYNAYQIYQKDYNLAEKAASTACGKGGK